MLDFSSALKRSSQQFNSVLREDLQGIMKCKFEVVEGVTVDDIAKQLDMLSGIDAWSIAPVGMRGVALRIQTGQKNWHTFTIRKSRQSGAKTEFEKRKYAIENGYLYPFYTVQAYVTNDNKLLAYAVARTQDIISAIEKGVCYVNKTGAAQIGQAEFYVVDWHKFKDAGYKIIISTEA